MRIRRVMTSSSFAVILALVGSITASGQFNSGSTGSDGALNFTTPGTVIFDPVALGLNPAGDNIFNFTTINIASGVTVKLTASKLREKSVVWLATGAVTVAGTLDLSGANGYPLPPSGGLRAPSIPGPGGYAGGVGADDSSPGQPGSGPGAYTVAGNYNGCASYATQGCGGPIYGNSLLVPLRGGSGGGGGPTVGQATGGGAGGGAIQIVSSVSITVTGSILANGGGGGLDSFGNVDAYAGSGGAIHIEAPTFTGSGIIQANGGTPTGCCSAAGQGWIRIDSNTNTFSGTVAGVPTLGPLFAVPLPTAVPTVIVTSINGISIPTYPTGSFSMPDITINSGAAVPVSLTAANIPIGTILKLVVSSETGADQVVSSSALSGTVASSNATANIVWPLGVSRVYVRATW